MEYILYILMGIITLPVLIVLFVLLLPILKKPIGWAFKLFINAITGFVGLWVLNLLGGLVGLHIDVNWITAILVGVLGLPGVVLLLVMQYLGVNITY